MVPKKFVNFVLMQRLMKIFKRMVTLITPQNSPSKENLDENYCLAKSREQFYYLNKFQAQFFYQKQMKFIEVEKVCRKFIFQPFIDIKNYIENLEKQI